MRSLLSAGVFIAAMVAFSPLDARSDADFDQEMARTRQLDDPTPAVHQLSFDGPMVISQSSLLPYGFQQKDIAPPFRLGIRLEPALNKRANGGMWLNADLGFLQTNLAPVMDLALGWKIKLDRWYLLFGAQITDQALPSNGPINQSQFDTTYFGLIGGFGYRDPRWDFNLKLKSVFYHDTPITSYEGIETDVAHDATVIESLNAVYSSGFGLKGQWGLTSINLEKRELFPRSSPSVSIRKTSPEFE